MKESIFIITILLLTSCTSNTILKKPKDLIPKDTMIMLITDLLIAKSANEEKNLNNNRKINYLPLVYNKYKIDSTRFKASNFYYTSLFEEYNLIYQEVNKLLEARKIELEKALKEDTEEDQKIDRVIE